MPRQPFLPTYKNKSYHIGWNSVHSRPEFLVLIGKCITTWSYVEHQMGLLLGVLLEAENDAMVAAYSTLRMGRAQRDALIAAGEVALSADKFALMRKVLKVVAATEKLRADIAHGHWGTLSDDQNVALWIESKHHSSWNASTLVRQSKNLETDGHAGLLKHLYVYKLRDLQEIYDQIELVWKILFDFLIVVRGTGSSGIFGVAGDNLIDYLNEIPILKNVN